MPDTPFLVFEDETFGVCPISSLKGHFLKRKSAYSSKDAVKIEKRLTYSPFVSTSTCSFTIFCKLTDIYIYILECTYL